MNLRLERVVWRRAGRVCEYCQMSQEYDDLPIQIDHIIGRKHEGQTTARNLALAGFLFNNHKWPNIAGRNPLFAEKPSAPNRRNPKRTPGGFKR
jgi:hypothetical protein